MPITHWMKRRNRRRGQLRRPDRPSQPGIVPRRWTPLGNLLKELKLRAKESLSHSLEQARYLITRTH